MRTSLLRRVGLAVASAAVTLASTIALIAPAQAAGPPCRTFTFLYQEGNTMVADREMVCDDPASSTGLPVTLQQKNPSTGAFVTVAKGKEGIAIYQCTGTAFRTYRTLPTIRTKSLYLN